MKSMLHEASCVSKAIEKAWVESGKPREFSITIHEQGKSGFFGIGSKPAIVSIQYDPSKQTVRSAVKGSDNRSIGKNQNNQQRLHNNQQQKNNTPQQKNQQQNQQQRQDRNQQQDRARRVQHDEQVGVPLKQVQQNQKTQQPQQEPRQQQKAVQPRQERSPEQQQAQQNREPRQQHQHDEIWTPDLIADVTMWTDELLSAMGIKSLYQVSNDSRSLTIQFLDEELLANEEPRHVAGSLSYLLIQFLKRKHKRKFRGFHIAVVLPKLGNQKIESHDQESDS